MKKLKYLLIILVTTNIMGCTSYDYHEFGIEDTVWNFAIDIIKNPGKIYNLQKNYPEFCNNKFFDTRMMDSLHLNYLYKFIIENKFNEGLNNYKIAPHGFTNLSVEDYKKGMLYENLTLSQLYGFVLEFDGKYLGFDFIKINNHYYLNDIYTPVIWHD